MTELTTESVFAALKSLLGVVDNPERRKQLEDYVEACRLPLDRAVSDLISQVADSVNTEVSGHYEVTLGYRPNALTLEVRAREPGEAPEEAFSMAEGDVEKITLRIPAELKELATEAAGRASLSVNAWFIRVLARALRTSEASEPPLDDEDRGRHRRHGRGPGGGKRLSGWVGPE